MTDKPNQPESNHCVLINAHILTMDADNSVAEALIIRDGRITAVGSSEEIKQQMLVGETVTDLQGKTVIPGFIDAHGHFPGSGFDAVGVDLNSPPIGQMINISQVLDALKERAKTTEKGEWIFGFGFDDTLMEEQRMVTREDLDSVSTDHKVYVNHISGHIGAGNSQVLEAVNIDKDTPDPTGGVICRDPESGLPTGILEEEAHFPVNAKAMNLSPEGVIKMLTSAVADYTSHGVTTAQAGLCDEEYIQGLAGGSQMGMIPIRVISWPNIELTDKIIEGKFDTAPLSSEMFVIGTAKIIGDGSIQGFTANLTKPYHTEYRGEAGFSGYPVTDRETMTTIVKRFHAAGLQIAIHGNGDATIDDIIHAVSEAQKETPREDTRHIIIHCQTVRDDQLQEMKRLGMTPSFFSAHAYYWGDRHRSIFLGKERADRMNPAKSALDMGIPFTIHLDTPITPMRPLILVWAAVNRLSTGENVIGADQRISAIQALRATTIDAAWQVFQEDNRGSIEAGKLGDLVVLSENPLDVPESIKDIEVLETVVGGKTVYKK